MTHIEIVAGLFFNKYLIYLCQKTLFFFIYNSHF
jgi:hypothetical protein